MNGRLLFPHAWARFAAAFAGAIAPAITGAITTTAALFLPLTAAAAPAEIPLSLPSASAAAAASGLAPLDTATPRLQRRILVGRLDPVAAAPSLSTVLLPEGIAHLALALARTGALAVAIQPETGPEAAEHPSRPAALFGVDALLVGSFEAVSAGRDKPWVRFALRAFDPYTGQVLLHAQASRAAATLAEALDLACADAARALATRLAEQPWQAYLLRAEGLGPGAQVQLSAGADQGLRPGMALEVRTQGDRVRSRTSGLLLALPGRLVGSLRVGPEATAQLLTGSLAGLELRDLVVRLPSPVPP